jgi:hypothetical protein
MPADARPESAASRALAPCRAVPARPEDLASIDAVVRHINALPPPATVACFLASLPRPLSIVATTSLSSAQPAFGARSPRVFILAPAVTLSVVAEGSGAALLEFGQWTDGRRSLKGEVELPPHAPLGPRAPFERVRYTVGSTCGFCHRSESSTPDAMGGFDSIALRPSWDSLVTVEQLRALPREACVDERDVSPRCLFWHGLFDYGDVRQGAFDPSVETLFR